MRILVYEFVTGGGWFSQGDAPPPESLLREGRAMLAALVADFLSLHGVRVDVLADPRQGELPIGKAGVHAVESAAQEQQLLAELSAAANWTVLIAPEFDGHLLSRCRLVEAAGGRLLGPGSALVELASDKHATAEHLLKHQVPAPQGRALARGEMLPRDFPYPAVLKPRDGAGSMGVERLASAPRERHAEWPARLEAFCPGMPASVAVLCGPRECRPLKPCSQMLDRDRGFAYLGGALPLPPPLSQRAQLLAARAIETLPQPRGYLGIDLVLGDEADGSGDTIIEINPRLTTSYVGLRALSAGNLAQAMVEIAAGRPVELCWQEGNIAFTADGRVSISK